MLQRCVWLAEVSKVRKVVCAYLAYLYEIVDVEEISFSTWN